MKKSLFSINVYNTSRDVNIKQISIPGITKSFLDLNKKSKVLHKHYDERYLAIAKTSLNKEGTSLSKKNTYGLQFNISQNAKDEELQKGKYLFTEQYHENDLDWYEFELTS